MRSTFGSSSVLSARVGSFWISSSVSISRSEKIISISTNTSSLENKVRICSASSVISPSIIEIISSPVSISVTDEVGESEEDSTELPEKSGEFDDSGELFSSEDEGFS